MRVDLPISDTWYSANDLARVYLGIADDPNTSVQVYLGVRHALWEITQSLANTFAHRRTLGCAPFSGPESEFVALQFAKEGFTVKSLSQDEFNSPKPWLETLGKQMLCVLSAYDDPATGELYQTAEHLDAMKDQRIFRVVISHSYHQHFELEKVGPYDVQIISVKPDLAIAVLGERAKLSPPIAANLFWPEFTLSGFTRKSSDQIANAKKVLTEFHKALPAGIATFYSSQNSLHDRALLLISNIEGLSFITALANEVGAKLIQPGAESTLETLSLCRWKDPRQLEWLAAKGLTVEKLRGSVVLSTELIEKVGVSKLVQAIDKVHKQLLAEQ